jgi:hypothetical protein
LISLTACLSGFAEAIQASSEQREVSLELLLALDVSKSIDAAEFRLQKQGISHAFRQPEVIQAILGGNKNGVAVGLMQWSSFPQWSRPALWMRIDDRKDAETFARTVDDITRMNKRGSTALGRAVTRGVREIRKNRFDGSRKILDVIGDGRSNVGMEPSEARDAAVSKAITINALAILTEDSELDRYFLDELVGGAGAFVINAESYSHFGEAIMLKLERELVGRQTDGRLSADLAGTMR